MSCLFEMETSSAVQGRKHVTCTISHGAFVPWLACVPWWQTPLAWHRLSGLEILLKTFPHCHQRLPQLAAEVAGYIEGHVQSENSRTRGSALCVRLHLIDLASLSKTDAKEVNKVCESDWAPEFFNGSFCAPELVRVSGLMVVICCAANFIRLG